MRTVGGVRVAGVRVCPCVCKACCCGRGAVPVRGGCAAGGCPRTCVCQGARVHVSPHTCVCLSARVQGACVHVSPHTCVCLSPCVRGACVHVSPHMCVCQGACVHVSPHMCVCLPAHVQGARVAVGLHAQGELSHACSLLPTCAARARCVPRAVTLPSSRCGEHPAPAWAPRGLCPLCLGRVSSPSGPSHEQTGPSLQLVLLGAGGGLETPQVPSSACDPAAQVCTWGTRVRCVVHGVAGVPACALRGTKPP